MISDLTASGCLIDHAPGGAPDDRLRIDVPGIGVVAARIVGREGGQTRCIFLDPLDADVLHRAALADARSGREVVVRWPRPVRAAIAIGGAAALWAAVAVLLL